MTKRRMRALHAAHVTPAEFHILLALVDGDRHGYGMMQQVAADSGGEIRLVPGTLYGALQRLLAEGLIREVDLRVDPDLDDARRRYYRLTAAGRRSAVGELERLAGLVRLARARLVLRSSEWRERGRRPIRWT